MSSRDQMKILMILVIKVHELVVGECLLPDFIG